MNAGLALEKEVKEAKLELETGLNQLAEHLPDTTRTSFEKKKTEIKRGFLNDIEGRVKHKSQKTISSNILSSISDLGYSFENDKRAIADIKEIRQDLEPLYREVQLFNPEGEEAFTQSLWWLINRGTLKTLEVLENVEATTPYRNKETIALMKLAREEIIERETKPLLEFFSFDSIELNKAIQKMIRNHADASFAPLPELFVPSSVSKAIIQLNETKLLIEKVHKGHELNKWLNTKNRHFLGETPRNVILKGKGFRVLQHFIRLGEGIS